eukprot:TRINITY_DN5194_c0_g1_i1.p1 TRINITY_DN5194_c0_g1~~TRINITY_DN5194_c0_g1_i1.p1  ORF type:complete len:165 (-),score=48.47 TRINITY_DN5194_c0_g1_i1:151-645(-)
MALSLSQDEMDKARAAFEQYDADGSGGIDIWELRDALKSLGQEPTEEELIQIISEVDDDEKGVIEFPAFLKLVANQKVVHKSREDDSDTLDAFVALGGKYDKMGHVDTDKLRKYIEGFGLTIDPRELVREMNTDMSGLIDYEQFKAMMLGEEVEDQRSSVRLRL